MKKVASRIVRLSTARNAWMLRGAVLLVVALLLCLFTLTPEPAKNQALALESTDTSALPTSSTTDSTSTSTTSATEVTTTSATEVTTTSATEVTTTSTTEATTTTTGAATTSTTAATTSTTMAQATVDVDVVVFGTQTSGLAAVHELALAAPQLRVALVSPGNLIESPLVQGLSVEDARDAESVVGGFYADWRQTVIRYYALMGKKAFTASGRFVYEPEVAATVMKSFISGSSAGNVLFYSAKLVDAKDEGEKRYVDVQAEGAGLVRLNTRFFVDASVEGDLARKLGADYRIGRDETLYNDLAGRKPAYPSAANGYVTAPQRFSALLTLQVYPWGKAPRVSDLAHPNYNPSTYANTVFAWKNVAGFASSWSMKIAVLPNNKRELNENWSDWPDIGLSYQWIFEPDKRGEIRKRVLEWTINRVRYLQEHGYPQVGLATVPQKLYVREGPRILGRDTYTVSDLVTGVVRDSVAMGCYVQYDRHDAFNPNHVETTRYVHMPMEALMVAGHPNLLVCTAVSTDYQAYSSAVRMELTRANMGAAAAMIVIVADSKKVAPGEAPYDTVRALLFNRGYRVE